MLMPTGKVAERPFGQTLGSLAQTRVTGQLSVTTCEGTYSIAFKGGHVVAASSPLRADSAAAIAVTHDLITPGQQIAIEHMLASLVASDELDACATIALLTPDEVHRLRRRAIAQRAARILALHDGHFLVTSGITLPVMPDSEIHVGGVIYQGACAYLGAPELAAIVARLGSRFTLRSDAFDELPYFGLGEREAGVVRALARGISIDELAAIPRPADWHWAHAAVYALASCGSLELEQSPAPQNARGTIQPVQVREPSESAPITKTPAAEAYACGQRALGAERLAEAVFAFQRAVELEPKDVGYITALAWARFCHAHDKHGVAAETRKVLSIAIARSTTPLLPSLGCAVGSRSLHLFSRDTSADRTLHEAHCGELYARSFDRGGRTARLPEEHAGKEWRDRTAHVARRKCCMKDRRVTGARDREPAGGAPANLVGYRERRLGTDRESSHDRREKFVGACDRVCEPDVLGKSEKRFFETDAASVIAAVSPPDRRCGLEKLFNKRGERPRRRCCDRARVPGL